MSNEPAPSVTPRYEEPSLLKRLLRSRESGVLIAFLLLFLTLAITRNHTFLSYINLSNLGGQITFTAISGIGVLFVILTGGVDLSVGSSVGLSSFVCAIVVVLVPNPYLGIAAGMLAALLTGALVGATNGAIVSYLRVTPFIVTLGMMGIARSMIYVLGRVVVAGHLIPKEERQSGPMPVTGIPNLFVKVGSGSVAGIPVPVLILVLLALAAHIVLCYSVFGRRLYAIGSNEEATLLSGINVKRTKLGAYLACSTICAITGFLELARVGSGSMEAGKDEELQAIAAAVIGGTSLMGGSGSVLGVILGACVIGLVANGMDMLDVWPEPKKGIIGAVIIAAAIVDVLRNRRRTG